MYDSVKLHFADDKVVLRMYEIVGVSSYGSLIFNMCNKSNVMSVVASKLEYLPTLFPTDIINVKSDVYLDVGRLITQ